MENESRPDTRILGGDEFVREPHRGPIATSVASRSFRIMKDLDPMPFGPYHGTSIGQVPAWYLDHLRDANWLDDRYPAVAEYIERNAKAIDRELELADRARSRH